jgi:bifunctional non-homologous end joining protein LigD
MPTFQPLPLVARPQPFSHPDWVYEIKFDGFRALAYIQRGRARLVSRNGNEFKSFSELPQAIAKNLGASTAVLDGELVCLDEGGCSLFHELFFHRGAPRFCAFDLLWLNGEDLRQMALIERKRALRAVLPENSLDLLYVDHLEAEGERLFKLACERDLEGVVAKHRLSHYTNERSNQSWFKIRNRRYSQMIGRDELFERRYEAAGAPEIGWNVCTRACVDAKRI